MKNLIKKYEEIPIDELTEDLQKHGVEFEENQFTEKLDEIPYCDNCEDIKSVERSKY